MGILFLFLLSIVTLLSSCASYHAAPLSPLCVLQTSQESGQIALAAKAFDKQDCKRYLDRDVIRYGYQPIQLQILNNSDTPYLFSLNRVSLSCARAEEVAEKVHTSTVGRAVGYGTAAVLTCGLFVIPAIVDGVKSAQANASLDQDFKLKTARDLVVEPYSSLNMLIFAHVSGFSQAFSVTLMDQKTGQPRTFHVIASRY